MKTAIYIPAKGTSKRISKKNTQILYGNTTLIEHCVDQMVRCECANMIVVDTDSEEIAALCDKYSEHPKFSIISRPVHLRGDDVGTPELVTDFLSKHIDIELLGVMHVTAPFLSHAVVDRCISTYSTNIKSYDCCFTVQALHDYLWKNGPLNFNVDCRTSTDSVDLFYRLTGGFFISTRQHIIENGSFIGNEPLLFPLSSMESIDVNYQSDLDLARLIMSAKVRFND